MVSRQESARALLTPGEVMQLPASDELVLVSGLPPIRAKKLRYYEDRNFCARVLPPPHLADPYRDRPAPRGDDWSGQVRGPHAGLEPKVAADASDLFTDGDRLRQQSAESLDELVLHAQSAASGYLFDDGAETPDSAADTTRRPITRAYAMNEGEDHDDLLPAF